MNPITQILGRIEQGDPNASASLLPLVYEELRQLAAYKLTREDGTSLQPTALVHEAYLRLVERTEAQQWNSRGHFFGAAAEAMRRILVDNARKKGAIKRGGNAQQLPLADQVGDPGRSVDLLALDEALELLAVHDERKAEVVKLRYFAGLTIKQTAAALGIAQSTADADWAYAKTWLKMKISK